MRNKIYICPLCDKKIEKMDITKAVVPASLGISKLCHLDCVKKKREEYRVRNTIGYIPQESKEGG